MILVFILFWFGALYGMEVEESDILQPDIVILPVPSLKDIALHRVCCYLAGGEISVNRAKRLPTDILQKIKEAGTPTPLLRYTTDRYDVQTLTPDHRYIMVITVDSTGQNQHTRLDLSAQASKVVDNVRLDAPDCILSPSGKLLAFLFFESLEALWIKDIAQNKVIVKLRGYDLIRMLGFIGENGVLVTDSNDDMHCISIKEKRDEYITTFKYLGALHRSGEYVVYKNGYFLGMSLEEETTRAIKASDFRDWRYTKLALYEPKMLIAYEQNKSSVGIQSLETAEVLSKLQYNGELVALSFAHKGTWLIVANGGRLVKDNGGRLVKDMITIWDWQHKQKLFELPWESLITHLSYTDHPTSYPCLFESNNVLYFFDPIKTVAAAKLTSKEEATSSNDNSLNNNNNNNDNGPAPTKSSKMEIDKECCG